MQENLLTTGVMESTGVLESDGKTLRVSAATSPSRAGIHPSGGTRLKDGPRSLLQALELARLKTRLLCLGVRLPEETVLPGDSRSGSPLGRTGGAGPAEGIFLEFSGTVAHVPVAGRFVNRSAVRAGPRRDG